MLTSLMIALALVQAPQDSVLHRHTKWVKPVDSVAVQIGKWWVAKDSIWQANLDSAVPEGGPPYTAYVCLTGVYSVDTTVVTGAHIMVHSNANDCTGLDVVGAFTLVTPTIDPNDREQVMAQFAMIDSFIQLRAEFVILGRITKVTLVDGKLFPVGYWVVWAQKEDMWVKVPKRYHSHVTS